VNRPDCIFERLALGPEGETIEPVGFEQVFLVVKRERPEAIDWRELVLGKSDGVVIGPRQALPRRIEIRVDVTRLLRRIVVHVGACGRSPRKIVRAPPRTIRR
jgi:hypothetical protein